MTQKPDNPFAIPSLPERPTRRGMGDRDSGSASPSEVFDSRPQSRGPEYHPPSLPAAPRHRLFVRSTPGSGTFRVGTPESAQALPPPLDPEVDDQFRPSSPTIPPLERAAARSSTPARRFGRGNKQLWWSAGLGLLLGTSLALAVVRVPVRAWGVLKAPGAPESLTAGVAGRISALRVGAGDEVEANTVVLQIVSAELDARLEARRAELEFSKQELAGAAKEEAAALQRNERALQRRRSNLTQRLELKDAEFAQRKSLLDEVTALVNGGSAPETDLRESSAALQATREARLGIVDALSQLDIEVTDRKSAQLARERARRARLAEAEASVQQAQAALRVTTVTAPGPGWIESLSVTAGSTVQAGAELARFVARDAPRSVVALVPLQDAADLAVGEQASVELSPHNQSAEALPARLEHVSREVASAARVQSILGAPSQQGFVQIELQLRDSPEYAELEPKPRSGSKALVSFEVPHRSLARVLSDAVSEWWVFRIWS